MTTKEKAIRLIEALPENARLGEIIDQLKPLEREEASEAEAAPASPRVGAWDLLQQSAGSLEMPADWSAEHGHHLYGTPKRSAHG